MCSHLYNARAGSFVTLSDCGLAIASRVAERVRELTQDGPRGQRDLKGQVFSITDGEQSRGSVGARDGMTGGWAWGFLLRT
jgi:hypothetical protein